MANNVFGAAITNATLEEMDEYKGKEITRLDRAHEALKAMHDAGKQQAASGYVQQLKSEYGDGVSTLCMVYNATGDPIYLQDNKTWHGYLWKGTYPQLIANGQWGAFLHVKPDWPNWATEGSSAGIVYRGFNNEGSQHDFLFSWYNPWRAINQPGSTYCKAYAQILSVDNFPDWDDLQRKTQWSALNYHAEDYGCVSKVTISDNTTSDYEAILTLKGA